MTRLPIVTVAPAYRGGWLAIRASCEWRLWCATRPPVDLEAEMHQGKCVRKGRD